MVRRCPARAVSYDAGGYDPHCFQALRNVDAILVANLPLFQEVVEQSRSDVIVSDEARDGDQFWHENPELKQDTHVRMTDFVRSRDRWLGLAATAEAGACDV